MVSHHFVFLILTMNLLSYHDKFNFTIKTCDKKYDDKIFPEFCYSFFVDVSHYGMSYKISHLTSYRVLIIKVLPHVSLPKQS